MIILQYHEIFFRLTAPRCPGMAAGAVSLRKSHDVVILSFCNIVKGQADCQHFWPAKNPNACSRWNSPGFLYILQLEDMLENKRAFDDPPKRFQSNISSSASLSLSYQFMLDLLAQLLAAKITWWTASHQPGKRLEKQRRVKSDLTKWSFHCIIRYDCYVFEYFPDSRTKQRPWRAIQKRTQKECFHYLGMQGFFSYQTPSSTDALRVMKWRCFAFIDQVIPTYAYFMWYYVY